MTKTAASSNRSATAVPGKLQKSLQPLQLQQPQPASSSAAASAAPLPQCKVKRNYACAKCNYYTQNPRSFLHHQKNVHAERIKVYECSYCLYASKHSQKLQRHVKMVHTGNRKSAVKDGSIMTTPLVPPVRIRVRFEKHAARPLAELVKEQKISGEPVETPGALQSEARAEEGTAECDAKEGHTAVDGGNVDDRVRRPDVGSSTGRPQEKQSSAFIRCSVCPYGSHSQTLVNKHEKTAHLKKKFFRCMKCNYVTHMRARYTKHVKYHTMPMIKCADCDFQTPYKWNLDRHNRNHSVAGTYRCSHCSFSADIKQSLTVHETNHHVPPVGGALSLPDSNRRSRRYRVGASDAPGSAVDGTEIVTFETTSTDGGGVVEIMTETKNSSVSPTKANNKSTVTPVPTESAVNSGTAASATAKTGQQNAGAPRRRPLPQLIPIGNKTAASPPVRADNGSHATTATASAVNEKCYYGAGQSALSDFASLIDDDPDAGACNVTSMDAPKSNKTAAIASSFFDKLKAKAVDETADLTCPVCRYESKCLSEFMRHQRAHGDGRGAADEPVDAAGDCRTVVCAGEVQDCASPPTALSSVPATAAPPVTAAELKSTRCQRCRKRCKTSAELVTHLATCRGTGVGAVRQAPAAAVQPAVAPKVDQPPDDDAESEHHPMENRIFVWNTAALPMSRDDADNGSEEDRNDRAVETIELPAAEADVDKDEVEAFNDSLVQQKQQLARKEGKVYKTVFKCPHCTFWAATASRFHVHIVGHLNRKPFECSCCAYRSNWRWDITKHIRLKTAKREADETTPNLHHGAKVLMTDETGRRNYSKYNRYLTVMEMDYVDGADNKVAGGDFEDGKAVAFKKVVGGGTVRKQRKNGVAASGGSSAAAKQTPPLSAGRPQPTPLGGPAKKFKVAAGWKPSSGKLVEQQQKQQQQQQREQGKKTVQETITTSLASVSPREGDNRSKTVWKCKKCLFRDCDRLTVLNHVRAHYQRGEFSDPDNSNKKSQNGPQNNKKIEKENTTEPSEKKKEEKTSTAERRKIKTPSTGTTSEKMVLSSANPKSSYDAENHLSCPLCDVVTSTSSELREHMQCVHIAEEIKYRCEYCPFWSEEKKAMLDHMMWAHEVSETGKTANSYRNEQWPDETNSNQNDDHESRTEELVVRVDSGDDIAKNGVVNRTKVELEVRTESTSNDDGRKYDENDKKSDNACDGVIMEGAAAATGKTVENSEAAKQQYRGRKECSNCLYFSDDREDMIAHRQLHVKRGALYNCAMCVFNVSRADVLYHHYRYGHCVEEPELRYPEETVIRAGHKDMVAKNKNKERWRKLDAAASDYDDDNDDDDDDNDGKHDAEAEAARSGPPLVWNYLRDNEPLCFTKVFKCRYCPHTNRRRHNTVEHERMHSDHPEHLVHRLQQQRTNGTSPSSPMHPCKRCSYVCNNAGVLASHVKVHSDGYGSGTVGFFDIEIGDALQILALEYVMGLEQKLRLDKRATAAVARGPRPAAADGGKSRRSRNCDDKYLELDDPELNFCPCCPARFFFLADIRCHVQFHNDRSYRSAGRFPCDRCSFAGRTADHVESHQTVHGEEYARRTNEIIAAGYRISKYYPQPPGYLVTQPQNNYGRSLATTAAVYRSPKRETIVEEPAATESADDGKQPCHAKRPLPCSDEAELATAVIVALPAGQQQDSDEPVQKRRRESCDETASTTKSLPPPLIAILAKTTTDPTPIVGAKAAVDNYAAAATVAVTVKSPVKQFQCNKCPARFFKATALQYHELLHGGTGPHRCRECDYAVAMYGNLIRHETVHQNLPPRKKPVKTAKVAAAKRGDGDVAGATEIMSPPSAPMIGIAVDSPTMKPEEDAPLQENDESLRDSGSGGPPFYYPTTVKNGVARPKRYRCSKCPSAFDKRSQFKIHVTLHGAGDKFQCDKCDYSVRYTANYVQHQRKHARDAELRKKHRERLLAAVAEQPAVAERPAVAEQPEPAAACNDEDDDVVDLEPKNTVFRNEISDRQTAYELDAAYGTGQQQTLNADDDYSVDNNPANNDDDGANDPLYSLFRCNCCPFECGVRELLDQHVSQHQKSAADDNDQQREQRSAWKHHCRFCSYRALNDTDMGEHTRGHFYRSNGAVLSSFAARTDSGRAPPAVGTVDHVEFHGKRVQIHGRRQNGAAAADMDDEPFFVFRDRGRDPGTATGDDGGTPREDGNAKRFSPDHRTPAVLIDYNDNHHRTGGYGGDGAEEAALPEDEVDKSQTKNDKPALVRYVNSRKWLEFVGEEDQKKDVRESPGKQKKIKKH